MTNEITINIFKAIIDYYNQLRHSVDEDPELEGKYDREETQTYLENWYHITGLILNVSYEVDREIFAYIRTIE